MVPASDLKGIERQEATTVDPRAVVLLLVKPSDDNADQLIEKFNYYHFRAQKHCAIYAAGYGLKDLKRMYPDALLIGKVEDEAWYYSDHCFVDFCEQLSERTKWSYCGEPEILILQTGRGAHSSLDFRNYVSIDAYRGVRKGYIESIPRLMESIINAAKEEVTAKRLVKNATRLSASTIAKTAIETALELPAKGVPKFTALKEALGDRSFYRSTIKKR